MTKAQIHKSIRSGQLQLSPKHWRTHFEVVYLLAYITPGFFGIMVLYYIWNYFYEIPNRFGLEVFLFMFAPIPFAALFYYIQKKRLEFKVIRTDLPRFKIDKIIKSAAKALEWKIIKKNNKVIIAKTNPPFISGSWGEHITILFQGNYILINSICDPEKHTSLASMGRNKQNVQILILQIEKAVKAENKAVKSNK